MITESIIVRGDLQIEKYDEQGVLVEDRTVKNVVVAAGKEVIASRLVGNTTPLFSHMAIGTSNTNTLPSQTTLVSELARVNLTSTTRQSNVVTYVGTFPTGTGTGTLAEAGIFNSGVTGSMLCRTRFNEIIKSAGDSFVITWKITIA